MSIGVLADTSATAIGADALLTRVGALYHDVGKIRHRELFVENWSAGDPHAAMMPADSARLIRRHVPDGVALVAEYRLGEPVPDFVREHHGTRWIEYFAHKAREAGLDCEPGDFQYPGPRPRSKETAILMIADQVEAISRTMPHATADDYRNLVRDVVDRLRTEGQLDQAPLTLRDLDRIRESIAGAVAGMHHRRIEYPPPVSPGALRDSPPK